MKKIKNLQKSLIIALLLMVLGTVAGCGQQEAKVDANPPAKTETAQTEDKEIRVVTTYKPATEIVLALGAKDKLVGANGKSKKDPMITALDPALAERLLEVGSKSGMNVEQIIALKPDVVVTNERKAGADTIAKLKEQNINVITIEPESLDLLQSDIKKVGEAIGESENADKLIAYYDSKLAYMAEKLKAVENKKTVYLAGGHGFLSTCSGDFYQHEIIELAGGKDVGAELKGGWNDVSVEQVLAWNPDVIASVMYCDGGKPSEIMAREDIQTLGAVKNKAVYQIPSNLAAWDMPQPSSILAIMWLGQKLYPEVFADLDMQAEANEYYTTFYGKSFDDLGGNFGESSAAN